MIKGIKEKIKTATSGNLKKKIMAYKILFDQNSPQARIVLKDLCEKHGVFDGGFDPNPSMRDFAAGERNVVLRILTITETSLDDLLQMLAEEDY